MPSSQYERKAIPLDLVNMYAQNMLGIAFLCMILPLGLAIAGTLYSWCESPEDYLDSDESGE